MKKEVNTLINKYAEVYKNFEILQKNKILAGGDQKTGVIAEYYAKCFIEYTNKDLISLEYAKPGASHDIIYKTKTGKSRKIQVKGVSKHSSTRTIAPLSLKDKYGNPSFDELFLIDLDLDFLPIAFYINSYGAIIKRLKKDKREKIPSSIMKDLENPNKQGSGIYDFSCNCNKIDDLLKAIK